MEEFGNHPIFEILYPDDRRIRIYANGIVEGAEGHCGIVNSIGVLTDSILFTPEIPGESLVERYRRIVAPLERYFSRLWANPSSPHTNASPSISAEGASDSPPPSCLTNAMHHEQATGEK